MTKLGLALFLFALGSAPAQAQTVFTMPPPAGIMVGGLQAVTSCGGASLSNGQLATATMDLTGKLCVQLSAGLSGTVSNASSGVATSTTNIGAVSWLYGFNGTTWDQIKTKAASVTAVATDTSVVTQLNPLSPGIIALGQAVKASSVPVTFASDQDVCSYAPKSSAPINITSATTTSIVAVSGSTTVYVCGFTITIAPSAVTADTALFEYGTGATCTSPTVLTGTFGNGDLTSTVGVAPVTYGGSGATIFKSAASAGVCILSAGNAVNIQGVLTYVQQ